MPLATLTMPFPWLEVWRDAQVAQIIFYHRVNDPPRSAYSVSPNIPLQGSLIPLSVPGFDRSKLPTFLYLWQPEPTMEKLSGR